MCNIYSRKTIVFSIACLMLFSCGCGKTRTTGSSGAEVTGSSSSVEMTESSSDVVSTSSVETTSFTTSTEYPYYYRDVEVPETEPLSDAYDYSLFEDWCAPVFLKLPFDAEDYLVEDEENVYFDIEKLTSDYGWKIGTEVRYENQSPVDYTYYYYDCGDMWVYLELGHDRNAYPDDVERDWVGVISYGFILPGEPGSFYYEYSLDPITETNNAQFCGWVNSRGQSFYTLGKGSDFYIYHDRAVLLCYLFSFVDRYPRYNPFAFEEFDHVRDYETSIKSVKEMKDEWKWDMYFCDYFRYSMENYEKLKFYRETAQTCLTEKKYDEMTVLFAKEIRDESGFDEKLQTCLDELDSFGLDYSETRAFQGLDPDGNGDAYTLTLRGITGKDGREYRIVVRIRIDDEYQISHVTEEEEGVVSLEVVAVKHDGERVETERVLYFGEEEK
ncbi:MAG: hypothetical protein J5636_03155 [Clostridiales bacterium]|nr:hypothetical protein [Clostridiales bacterium]